MRMRTKYDTGIKRMLSYTEACEYMGIGISSLRRFAAEYPCTKKIGKRVLFDKIALDKYLDDCGYEECEE